MSTAQDLGRTEAPYTGAACGAHRLATRLAIHIIAIAMIVLSAQTVRAAVHATKNITSSVVFVWPEYVAAGTTVTFETEASAGVDPVMHLMSGIGTWNSEIAYNDDGAGYPNARIQYTAVSSTWVTLIVRSWSHTTQGLGRVKRNGSYIGPANSFFGGTKLPVPSDANDFRTAKTLDGTDDTVLLLLRSDGRAIKGDDDSGVGLMSRVDFAAGVGYAVVGSFSEAGTTNFYANDRWYVVGFAAYSKDADGDELGPELERELGICDSPTTNPGCEDVYNLLDSDRDGIQDTFEVFGKDDASFPQHLPAWGADPRRKDIFVEVDWRADMYPPTQTTNPFSESSAVAVMARYSDVPGMYLKNLGGINGVITHLDIGKAPSTLNYLAPYGSWGGSNRSPAYGLATARQGIFFQARLNSTGGASTEFLSWKVDAPTSDSVFAHELGHNIGLDHFGHPSFGAVNCKPNYVSVMNYAFQESGVGFSAGGKVDPLQPSAISEQAPPIVGGPAYLASIPGFGLHVAGSTVDWNRSGTIESWPNTVVRAPITMAAESFSAGCGASLMVREPVRFDVMERTPDIVRAGSNLYYFWLTPARDVQYRSAPFVPAPTSTASCSPGLPGGVAGQPCQAFGAAMTVPTTGATALTVVEKDGAIVLVYRDLGGDLYETHAALQFDGTLGAWSAPQMLAGPTPVGKEPELTLMYVDPARFGTSVVIGLFYLVGSDHRWRWTANPGGAWAAEAAVTDATGSALQGFQGPAITIWPTMGPSSYANASVYGACGVFPDVSNTAGFFCYEKATDRWVDLSARLVGGRPSSVAKPAIAYHVLRAANGSALGANDSYGQFWIVTVPSWLGAETRVSTAISEAVPPSTPGFSIQRMGGTAYLWDEASRDAGYVLYEDGFLAALKGARVAPARPPNGPVAVPTLEATPVFDGSFSVSGPGMVDFADGKLLERCICVAVRSGASTPDSQAYCGDVSTSGWSLNCNGE